MYERLADLDELTLRCRTDSAKEYIREAVASYRAGAYRAAVVSTWIALVYDLIDKIRELSLTGDTTAEKLVHHFEAIQDAYQRGDPDALKRSQEFERSILDQALKDFELFSTTEKIDLERLKEDRHRCAHPTMNQPAEAYKPTAELARLHLRNAITHVLERPPVQGKAAFEQIKQLLASAYFPTNQADVRQVLAEGPLQRPRPSLISLTVELCLSRIFDTKVKGPERKKYILVLLALLEMHPQETRTILAKILRGRTPSMDDGKLRIAIGLLTYVGDLWIDYPEGVKSRLKTMLLEDDTIVGMSFFPKLTLVGIPEVRDPVLSRIGGMHHDQLTILMSNGGGEVCLDRTVELYSTVRNWNDANAIASNLIIPLVAKLTWEHIIRIVRSPRVENSDLIGSNTFPSFLTAVARRDDINKDELYRLLEEEDMESEVARLKSMAAPTEESF